MKTGILTAACVAALFGLGSCANQDGPETGNGTKGDSTYASFKVSVASNGTRANSEDAGLAEEQRIAQMQLYVFADGILELHQTVTLNDNGKTSPVRISTGEKIIYAIASPATGGNASYLTDPEGNEIEAVAESTNLADFQKQLFNALSTQIATPDEFVMIGRSDKVAVVKCKEAEAETKNLVRIDVDRATAKALVKYVSEDENAVKVRETINATFSEPKFLVAQAAREMVMTPYNRLAQIATGVYTPLGTKTDGNGTYSGYTPMPDVTTATFKDACTDWSNATTCDEFEYFAENRTENPVTGNTTFALIRLKATPNAIYSGAKANTSTNKVELTAGGNNANGDFWTVVKHDAVTGSLIYASDENYKILYFTTEDAAKAYRNAAKLKDYTTYKFTGGLVYYRVNLVTDKDSEDLSLKYRVNRNSYYQINVTDIKALGAHDGGDVVPTDPDQPLDPEGWLVAQITVRKWTVIDMDNTVLQ